MKLLIVGLGSMGKRRARLLAGVAPGAQLLGVDANPARRREAQQLGVAPYESIEAALAAGPDAALVCTAPLSHAGIITRLLTAGLPVFTELNLVADGYAQNLQLAREKGLLLFLSSTMLYRGEPQYLIRRVRGHGGPLRYRYHVGQYLPDWHPWENYKDFFVGDSRTGGCREIFGIELPWLLAAFGPVARLWASPVRLSGLQLPYPDSWLVTLAHGGGAMGQLMVDVVSPAAVRSFEAVGDGLQLFWEGRPDALFEFDPKTGQKAFVPTYDEAVEQDPRYSSQIVENAYREELREFLRCLQQGAQPRYGFAEDLETLALIDRIEAAGAAAGEDGGAGAGAAPLPGASGPDAGGGAAAAAPRGEDGSVKGGGGA